MKREAVNGNIYWSTLRASGLRRPAGVSVRALGVKKTLKAEPCLQFNNASRQSTVGDAERRVPSRNRAQRSS